jgi:hypothetical protein
MGASASAEFGLPFDAGVFAESRFAGMERLAMLNLHFVFQYHPRALGFEVWDRLLSSISRIKELPPNTECVMDQQKTTIEQVFKILKNTASDWFHAKIPCLGNHFELLYCPKATRFAQLFVTLGENPCEEELTSIGWSLMMLSGLLYGRIYDPDFDFIQNATDPQTYKAKGCSLDGLRLVDDPYTLGGKKIDISQNSGRAVWYDNYVERISHVMWFTKLFWQHTNQMMSTFKWAERTEQRDDVVLLAASKEPFTIQNPQHDVARLLRAAAFPIRDDGRVM